MKQIAIRNHVEYGLKEPGTEGAAKVRFGLNIVWHGKKSSQDSPGQPETRRHTLRADGFKTNHFYFGQWHIVTTPKGWNKTNRAYAMEIIFFRVFGEQHEVEEKLGSVSLSGSLRGKQSPYILEGIGHKILKNQRGDVIAEITAGYQSPQQKTHISKHSGPEKGPEAPRQPPLSVF